MRAIFWDLDGVLVPTEPLYDRAHQDTVEHFGGSIPLRFYFAIHGNGRPHKECRREFIRQSGIVVDEEEYTRVFRVMVLRYKSKLEPTPGVEQLLTELYGRYRMAVVAASRRDDVTAMLKTTNLQRYFEFSVTQDDVVNDKPAPDSYLQAKNRFGIQTGFAIEDSIHGLQAALGAGLKVIVYRHSYNQNDDFTGAIAEVKSFLDPKIHQILNSATL